MFIPVLLSGGSGNRLWPVSRASFPKQFVKLLDERQSLLQNTVTRLDGLRADMSGWIVVGNHDHRFLLAEQLREAKADVHKILLEPVSRNTAPALALAALESLKLSTDAKMLVQTADHVIPDADYLCDRVRRALASEEPMVTFGVRPTRAETGYGYIESGQAKGNTGLYECQRFVEKPDANTAAAYVKSGNYLWNSGMFVLDAATFIAELDQFEPEMMDAVRLAHENALTDLDFTRVNADSFERAKNVSVDYACMERSKKVTVLPFESEWSDLGAWDSVSDQVPADANGNAALGDGLCIDSTNTFIRSESRMVAALGVDGLTIIETPDAVLVAHKERSQDVKKIVEQLQSSQRTEAHEHTVGHRPWGHYQCICNGERFQVKRIEVKPGQSLSLQMHHHRAEHWIVVSGTAEVTVDNKVTLLQENQSTYIPLGAKHRLSNPGKVNLVLIEVQSGSYLGEDDIVRFEDAFGRA